MMGLQEFAKCIGRMTVNGNEKNLSLSDRNFRKIYQYCMEVFNDRDKNLKRWLLGKPCIFCHPQTEQYLTVDIGQDIEALYYFLLYCYKLNNQLEISEDFSDYLALVLSRSQYRYDGD